MMLSPSSDFVLEIADGEDDDDFAFEVAAVAALDATGFSKEETNAADRVA